MPFQVGKIPVVVPRQKKFDEHVNDHQLEFAKEVQQRQGNMFVVEDIADLKDILLGYEALIEAMPAEHKSNNARFNEQFTAIVDELFV
jgi:UDP-N-acetylglucosamine transferase subunit ALG13